MTVYKLFAVSKPYEIIVQLTSTACKGNQVLCYIWVLQWCNVIEKNCSVSTVTETMQTLILVMRDVWNKVVDI